MKNEIHFEHEYYSNLIDESISNISHLKSGFITVENNTNQAKELSDELATNTNSKNNLYRKFQDKGINIDEYNAIMKFLDIYDTNEENTLSKMSLEESYLVKNGMDKLKK